MTQISILGCGWLGLPLAQSLVQNQFRVNGSTTSKNKISVLKNCNITPFLIELNEDAFDGNFEGFLANSNILIIDIPPKLRGNSTEKFVTKIKNTIPLIEKSGVTKVIFVSSTSVYPDDNSIVNHLTIPKPDSESGRQLLEVEKLLQSNPSFKTTVLRFGGLIGNDRHPIKMLAGKTGIANPDASVNLIHQNDCILILQKIIKTDSFGKTYNAVAPQHPTRKDYYTTKAIEFNMPAPEYDHSKPSVGKTILSDFLVVDLNFEFTTKI